MCGTVQEHLAVLPFPKIYSPKENKEDKLDWEYLSLWSYERT